MLGELVEFPKMARLSRMCTITEKIDGTNAQVFIMERSHVSPRDNRCLAEHDVGEGKILEVYAGSRTRWLSVSEDNFGFAKWVQSNSEQLAIGLGEGRHFGEFFGFSIQRGYGLPKGEKRFSLFNTVRWCKFGHEPKRIHTEDPRIEKYQQVLPECCDLVPVLYEGVFSTMFVDNALEQLRMFGSMANPGFKTPEGVVVWHHAANVGFKKTLENDGVPKSKAKQ